MLIGRATNERSAAMHQLRFLAILFGTAMFFLVLLPFMAP